MTTAIPQNSPQKPADARSEMTEATLFSRHSESSNIIQRQSIHWSNRR